MSRIKTKNIVKIVICVLVLAVIGFGVFWLKQNQKAISEKVINNTTLYTQDQVDQKTDDAYNQGYNDAHKDNAELKAQVNELTKNVAAKQATISQNNKTIEENNKTISILQEQLNATNQSKLEEKNRLQAQIDSLKLINERLSENNKINAQSLTELNAQLTSLQNQIGLLSQQKQENENKVNECEANHGTLQNSITYYEQFIQALETDTQAVAIYEAKSSIYKVQILSKGTHPTIANPSNTETETFVGWFINDEQVDLNTYTLTTNTTFVAKFDLKYNARFMLDETTEHQNFKVAKNDYVSESVTNPTKDGYDFDGWTLDRINVIDYATYPITQNTTFFAKFTKVHIVTFIAKEVVSTQKIRNGGFAQNVEVIDNGGWKVNNELVDLSEYQIFADTTFTADLFYTIIFIDRSGNAISTQKIRSSESLTSPDVCDDTFMGWTNSDGEIVENVSNVVVTQNMTFKAKHGTWREIDITSSSPLLEIQGYSSMQNNLYKINEKMIDTMFNVNSKVKIKFYEIQINNELTILISNDKLNYAFYGSSGGGYMVTDREYFGTFNKFDVKLSIKIVDGFLRLLGEVSIHEPSSYTGEINYFFSASNGYILE